MPAVASSPAKLSAGTGKGFTVLVVGRFVALKGFDVAIRAFEKFRSSQPVTSRNEIKMILVGKGPEKERLQRIASEELISYAIEWVDWVDKVQMEKIYQKADVFLFPSHEGAGMVIPEALSFGLPVICFDNFGPGELTNKECAIRVSYNSYKVAVQDFATALGKIYNNYGIKERMSSAAFRKWENDLTWDVKGLFLHNIYNEVSQMDVKSESDKEYETHCWSSNSNTSLIESEF